MADIYHFRHQTHVMDNPRETAPNYFKDVQNYSENRYSHSGHYSTLILCASRSESLLIPGGIYLCRVNTHISRICRRACTRCIFLTTTTTENNTDSRYYNYNNFFHISHFTLLMSFQVISSKYNANIDCVKSGNVLPHVI